jgi:inosine/xanthosine triphosphate pyrophosphatase family protein
MSVEPSSDDILNTGSTPLQDRTNTRFETELAEKEEEIARLTGLVKGMTKKRGRGRRRAQFVCVISQAFD